MNLHDWQRGLSWIEAKERQRKRDERMRVIGLMAGCCFACLLAIAAIGFACGGLP